MKSKGWGPFRFNWYSFCSAHQEYNKECKTCQAGSWINAWQNKFEAFLFKHNPDLWMWWANGRHGVRPRFVKRK